MDTLEPGATSAASSRHPDHQGMDSQPAEGGDRIGHRGPVAPDGSKDLQILQGQITPIFLVFR